MVHDEPARRVGIRFDAILYNLLSNAIRYQNREKSERVVRVSTWSTGEDFYLSIEDNGVGIPDECREKVFQLFHRLANDSPLGTGLGLPLVKKNVTRLDGGIDLDCDNGWTTFTVRLPQSVAASLELVGAE